MFTSSKRCRLLSGATVLVSLGLATAGTARADSVAAGQRYALVMGNTHYTGINQVSGKKDAEKLNDALREIGFTTPGPVTDADLKTMNDALDSFKEKIKGASLVIFYYSGHAFRLQFTQQGKFIDENFLLPIGGSINKDSALPFERVLETITAAPREAVKIVIIDACRVTEGSPKELKQGLAHPRQPPANTLYAFATGYGQVAESGEGGELSPYSQALLNHVTKAGLEIRDLLAEVHRDVLEVADQVPREEGLDALPLEVFLRPPVTIRLKAEKVDDDLLVILRGKVVMDAAEKPEDEFRLKAGDNDFVLMVANGKTFHNGHTWERTEGWSYDLSLRYAGGPEILCEENGQPVRCFRDDGERVPFKDGPHHGKVFVVARANIFVDPKRAQVEVRDLDTKVWNRDAPVWARDQAPLFEKIVKELPLDDILDPGVVPNLGVVPGGTVSALLRELLKTGKLLGQQVADPAKTFFVVRGNILLTDLVKFCMEDKLKDRIKDLSVSAKAALERHQKPFETFDQGLMHCVQKTGIDRGMSQDFSEMRVWTAVEDRSRDQDNVTSIETPATGSAAEVSRRFGQRNPTPGVSP